MFSKIVALLSLAIMAITVNAGPVAARSRSLASRTDFEFSWPSFNSWGGHKSLDRFDDFYGRDDFSHHKFNQVFIKKEKELVCRTVEIEVIQQRLVILQEMAKKIITEQICEVETQVVVFQQFHGSLGNFHRDLRRYSGHQVGYDDHIASYASQLFHPDGSLTDTNFGFSGKDVGQNTVIVGGNNWNDATSPVSVGSAFDQSKSAFVSQD